MIWIRLKKNDSFAYKCSVKWRQIEADQFSDKPSARFLLFEFINCVNQSKHFHRVSHCYYFDFGMVVVEKVLKLFNLMWALSLWFHCSSIFSPCILVYARLVSMHQKYQIMCFSQNTNFHIFSFHSNFFSFKQLFWFSHISNMNTNRFFSLHFYCCHAIAKFTVKCKSLKLISCSRLMKVSLKHCLCVIPFGWAVYSMNGCE